MKKSFKYYAVVWALLFAVYNVFAFAVGFRNDASFWAAYISIVIAMSVQLVCAKISFKPEKLDKLFLNIPVIKISFTGMVLSMIIGSVCIAVPNIPFIATIVVEYAVLAVTGIAVLKANAAAEVVENIDAKIKANTAFIKGVTVEAESLLNSAKTPEEKDVCKKVYEALRYSDPMSNSQLEATEKEIETQLGQLSFAIKNNDLTSAQSIADELVGLIKDRNGRCKLLK